VTDGFAFECFADREVARFLRLACGLRFKEIHAYSQGEVVNEVTERGRAIAGMVDEDPGRTHHRRRDAMAVISRTDDLEVRRGDNRHLVIVRPDLETCFLRSMDKLGLNCALGGRRSNAASDPRDRKDETARPVPRRYCYVVLRVERTEGPVASDRT
jgi:hypothetical protein